MSFPKLKIIKMKLEASFYRLETLLEKGIWITNTSIKNKLKTDFVSLRKKIYDFQEKFENIPEFQKLSQNEQKKYKSELKEMRDSFDEMRKICYRLIPTRMSVYQPHLDVEDLREEVYEIYDEIELCLWQIFLEEKKA